MDGRASAVSRRRMVGSGFKQMKIQPAGFFSKHKEGRAETRPGGWLKRHTSAVDVGRGRMQIINY